MQPSAGLPWSKKVDWSYVSLQVRDGDRLLKPSHVSFDRLIFPDPPRIESAEVEVIITNGEVVDRRMVNSDGNTFTLTAESIQPRPASNPQPLPLPP